MRRVTTAVVFCALLCLCAANLQAGPDPLVCIAEGSFQPPPAAPAAVRLDSGLSHAIYEGATPAGLDPERPVLIFVAGLHGDADSWWGETEYYGDNDMYDAALHAGYKAFFVDLDDASGNASSGVDNGEVLKEQLEWISNYWGNDRFNAVVHSKGGVDSNIAALMGAPIDTIFSIAGAHWGSPLADLAQTDWLDWLAALIGFNDAGTKFMQTACMALVRDLADVRPQNDDLSIYTVAGTGWGPFLSYLEFGGLYLAVECPGSGGNDGVVCVEHAKHPLSRDENGIQSGSHRLTWHTGGNDYELDHDAIRQGNAFLDFFWWWDPTDCYVPVWDEAELYVGQFHSPGAPVSRHPAAAPPARNSKLWNLLRGGAIEGGRAETSFPVEPGARRLDVSVLVSGSRVGFELVAPDGTVHRAPAPGAAAGSMFRGAHSTGISVKAPAAGLWTAKFRAPERAAYALSGTIDSALSLSIDAPAALLQPGAALVVDLGGDVRTVETSVRIRRTSTRAAARPAGDLRLEGLGRHSISLPEPGVYNLALTFTGLTADGAPFERSKVLAFAVKDPAGSQRLPSQCE